MCSWKWKIVSPRDVDKLLFQENPKERCLIPSCPEAEKKIDQLSQGSYCRNFLFMTRRLKCERVQQSKFREGGEHTGASEQARAAAGPESLGTEQALPSSL